MRVRFPPGPHDAKRQSGGNESGGNRQSSLRDSVTTASFSRLRLSPEDKHFTRSSPQGIPTLCFVLCSLFFEDAQRQTFHEVIPAGDSNFVLCALLFVVL
ncbi:hypothetical protein SKC35_01800 [Aquirufa sp. KTFRIE-69F]|uniref:Uncharacterized protein n=1 Tax=Aquirufa originis TaxID=3096514 RepID=A0ABW6D2G7_9BACT